MNTSAYQYSQSSATPCYHMFLEWQLQITRCPTVRPTTTHYHPLPPTASHNYPLPPNTTHYQLLPPTTFHNHPLPSTTTHYLPVIPATTCKLSDSWVTTKYSDVWLNTTHFHPPPPSFTCNCRQLPSITTTTANVLCNRLFGNH